MRIIYYYQTFVGMKSLLSNKANLITHIHLSSIHFGYNSNGTKNTPYIHLNNFPPNDPKFNEVWEEMKWAKNRGIRVVLMIGGAGGGYSTLFSDFPTFYKLLSNTIKQYPQISGIDLDIEEPVTLDNVKQLINAIYLDFGEDFIISMAPVQSSLQEDYPGMGGFVYKDLFNSKEGQKIHYFNGQFYGDYSEEAYNSVVKNGYTPEKVVMGMISFQDLDQNVDTLKTLKKKYGKEFGGVFNWEYYDSPPGGESDPNKWAEIMEGI
jgi:chitinase